MVLYNIFVLQLASLDGIHSGVPTRTTATLTPTTLRNIEQVSMFTPHKAKPFVVLLLIKIKCSIGNTNTNII